MRYILFIFLITFSCSSKKDILLIQNASTLNEYNVKYNDLKIMPDDILRIKISSNSPELSTLYNFSQLENNATTLESFQINGYLVNSDGYVKIPSLNSVFVKDLTISEASNLIEKMLIEKGELKNSTVDVKIVNSYFTVIGEVKNPGRYNFINNNMDVFQALGMAGDLTINGKRDDIRLLRKNNDIFSITKLDITSSEIFKSNAFQIYPGDIIIVNPNNARVKNAGVIGNSGNLLSVLSFILSSLILITSN